MSADPGQLPAPTNSTEWAYAMLLTMGIDPLTHSNSVADLAAQINLEQGSNTISGNNPLNSTQPVGGSVGGGSQGNIQSYQNWIDGLTGNVDVILQPNQSSLYNALQKNASISDYATALGKAHWISDQSAAPNQAYGASVAARYNSMTQGKGYSFAPLSAAYSAFNAGGFTFPSGVSSGPGISDIPKAAAGIAATGAVDAAKAVSPAWGASLGTLLGDLTSSDFWKRVGLGTVGVVLVVGGLILFISTTKTGQKVESDAAVAAVAA